MKHTDKFGILTTAALKAMFEAVDDAETMRQFPASRGEKRRELLERQRRRRVLARAALRRIVCE